jgi:hypothetical protein
MAPDTLHTAASNGGSRTGLRRTTNGGSLAGGSSGVKDRRFDRIADSAIHTSWGHAGWGHAGGWAGPRGNVPGAPRNPWRARSPGRGEPPRPLGHGRFKPRPVPRCAATSSRRDMSAGRGWPTLGAGHEHDPARLRPSSNSTPAERRPRSRPTCDISLAQHVDRLDATILVHETPEHPSVRLRVLSSVWCADYGEARHGSRR